MSRGLTINVEFEYARWIVLTNVKVAEMTRRFVRMRFSPMSAESDGFVGS